MFSDKPVPALKYTVLQQNAITTHAHTLSTKNNSMQLEKSEVALR